MNVSNSDMRRVIRAIDMLRPLPEQSTREWDAIHSPKNNNENMVNKVIIIGNVGSDPEVRVLDGGAKVASLSVATTDRYTDRQTKTVKEITEWHHVVAWRNTADIVDKYVKKGAQIYVEGRLRTRDYTDRDSIKRYITEIMADTVRILGRRESQASCTSTTSQMQSDPDDLPF